MTDFGVVETITTNGTFGNSVMAIAVGLTILLLVGMVYSFYKYLCGSLERETERAAIRDKKIYDEVYLSSVYSAYKAGLVYKTAKDNGIEMKFNDIVEDDKGLIKKLNDDVNNEITNKE